MDTHAAPSTAADDLSVVFGAGVTQIRRTRERSIARPLSTQEVARAKQVATRLLAELRAITAGLPAGSVQTRPLARSLKIDRNICQQVLSALSLPIGGDYAGLTALTKLPGTAGLKTFSKAVERAVDPSGQSTALLHAAVGQFESLIAELGGSQKRVIARIEATLRSGDSGAAAAHSRKSQDQVRKRLFDVSAEAAGQWMNAHIVIAGMRPGPGNTVQGLNVTAQIGVESVGVPVPLTTIFNSSGSDAGTLSGIEFQGIGTKQDGDDSRVRAGLGLIDGFCSTPLPLASLRKGLGPNGHGPNGQGPNGQGTMVQIIDGAALSRGQRVDVVTGRGFSLSGDPVHELQTGTISDPFLSQSVRVKHPARRLIVDMYMHETYAKLSIPTLAAYHWHPGITEDATQHWHELLPGSYAIQLIGRPDPMSQQTSSDAWDRHRELTMHVFEQAGWDAGEMVGYRADIAYPYWGATYYFTFDFRSSVARTSVP